MKKFFLIITLAFALMSTAQAQNQFFGVDPDKFVFLIDQAAKMPRDNAMLIVDQTMKVMADNPKGYRKTLEIAINKLGTPADPIHNEDLYITVLKHATTSTVLGNSEKVRPKALLESALKNCAGSVAADIDYVTPTGEQGNLLKNDNKFTLLLFNDPDCESCSIVKEKLGTSQAIKQAVDDGVLRVVAINPMDNEKQWKRTKMPEWIVNGWNKSQSINEGGSYDMPTLPVFYVLGRDNTVLLKNEPSLKRIEKAVATLLSNADADATTLINLLFAK